jgi:Phosphopantothenoylcysteine synthetase/decarboxylase
MKKNVLFLLSGSIACYKACAVVSRLAQAGVTVQTGATAAALKFVGAATLEGLSGRAVFSEVFEQGRALDHIELARAADLAIVCPATANTLNKLAAGIGDDPVSTLFLAWELKAKPWLVAPAMNAMMWEHPATKASMDKLRSWGVRVIGPVDGPHACGEGGAGRLLEPEEIAAEVLRILGETP